MAINVEDRLKELHIELPEISPIGLYQPAVKSGSLIYVSGQLPRVEGRMVSPGRVGREVTLEAARKAARLCLINALAALRHELGSLNKLLRIIKLTGYVTSGVGFCDQHKVIDGASELIQEIFGEAGGHARAAVGVVELPMGAPVEIELVAELKLRS